MTSKILNGRVLSDQILSCLVHSINELIRETGIIPGLSVILIGSNQASRIYVKQKKKACERIGIHSEIYTLPENVSQIQLLNLIDVLNQNQKIHGILVQMPWPGHLDRLEVLHRINPLKDVDGFHPQNMGGLQLGTPLFPPCTPAGILLLLKEYGICLLGKHAVVVGCSYIVGRPMVAMLLTEYATVTSCHIHTQDLSKFTRQADILIVAVGKPKLITKDMIKSGAVVIDVGINKIHGKLVGDVDFEQINGLAEYITPVPGGVGPMTIAVLMLNTVKASIYYAWKIINKEKNPYESYLKEFLEIDSILYDSQQSPLHPNGF